MDLKKDERIDIYFAVSASGVYGSHVSVCTFNCVHSNEYVVVHGIKECSHIRAY